MSAVKVWVTVEVRGERTCVVELDGQDFTDADLLEAVDTQCVSVVGDETQAERVVTWWNA